MDGVPQPRPQTDSGTANSNSGLASLGLLLLYTSCTHTNLRIPPCHKDRRVIRHKGSSVS
jgi:hypothetical protein